jgi:hypothetical protein
VGLELGDLGAFVGSRTGVRRIKKIGSAKFSLFFSREILFRLWSFTTAEQLHGRKHVTEQKSAKFSLFLFFREILFCLWSFTTAEQTTRP